MARTPLLRALRSVFREHRTARRLGVPVERLRERRARAAEEAAAVKQTVASGKLPAY